MLTSTQLTAASTGNWLFQFLRQWSSAAGISLVLAGLPLCSLLVHSPPTLSAKILPESFIWCHFLSHFPFPHSFSYDVLISSYSLMVLSGRLWEVAEIKCVQSATPHWGHDRSPIHQTDTSIAISGDHVVSPSRNGSSQRTYGHICFWLSQCIVRRNVTGNYWVEDREAAKHPAMLGTAPTTRNDLGQLSIGQRLRNSTKGFLLSSE